MRAAGRSRRGHVLGLTVVWLVAALYLHSFAYRGWLPHDEGQLAHGAERVLHGELPHRDFDEPYTGGLSGLYAAAFAVLGVRLTAIRTTLVVVALLFVPFVYAIAARFAPPHAAALVTLLCFGSSFPVYFAGLPSWYNLFFATLGTYALLRHLDTGRRRWLVVAGLAGGLGILVKSVGAYWVAAALLHLVYREQLDAAPTPAGGRPSVLLMLDALAMAVLVGLLLALVRTRSAPMEVLHFVAPGAALAALVVWSEWHHGGPSLPRLARLARTLVPFAAGVLVPVAAFLLLYLVGGGWDDVWRGMVVLPRRRLESAAVALPSPWTLRAALPYAALLAWPAAVSVRVERIALAILVPILAALALRLHDPSINVPISDSIRPICPAVVLVGCFLLGRAARTGSLTPKRRAEMMLLLSVAALTSLIQFPYSSGVYFAYVAPFVILAVTAVVTSRGGAPLRLHLAVAAFYLAFAVIYVHPRNTAILAGPPGERALLDLERGGLEVSRGDEALYTRLVREIQRHSAPGDFIYAAPDSPQIYFLSARRNATHTMYDFFDPDFGSDTHARTERILRALEEKQVQVVVINWRPPFTPWIARDLVDALRRRYPNEVPLPPFSVRWRS